MENEKYKDAAYNRNLGFFSVDEQKLICDSHISLAGAGGDGLYLGLLLIMNGCQNIKVADPETFEKENSNRVIGATVKNYGRNKADVFKEMALEINPDANVEVYTEGVNEDNVEDFMQGSDLLIDESELRYFHIAVMLGRAARKLMIPNMTVMNIGFAGVGTSFDPAAEENGSATIESLLGLRRDMPLDEVKGMSADLSNFLPYIPGYGDIEVLKAVSDGAPLPSIAQGVSMAAGIGSTQAFLHIVKPAGNNRPNPIWAPRFVYNDCYTNSAGVIEVPKLSYKIGVAKSLGRSALGLNPRASYGSAEREKRLK